MSSIAFYTLGCKLNYSETSTLSRQFKEEGFVINDFENGADIYVINTCSVTDHADRKTKRIVKEGLKKNPQANVVVIGCYAQLKPEEITNIPGVTMVLGAKDKFKLLQHIQQMQTGCEPAIFNTHIKEAETFTTAYSVGDRTRSFLKIQDGCNYFCAFCTIPLARGKSRSSTVAETAMQAMEIGKSGVKEIVLTGVNIGDFNNESGETFFDILKALDAQEDGVERIRISSIEPNLLTDEIIEFVAQSNKIVPHFHVPLQSGSDKILELMRRRYLRNLYAEKVAKIKSLMPHACIGVDVIVGFPSETEEDFQDTFDFISGLDIGYLHVFTYSERPDTTALRIKGRVPNNLRNQRNKILTDLSHQKRKLFYESQLNQTRSVLWEADRNGEFMHGFTDNYVKIRTPFNTAKINKVQDVLLAEINEEGTVDAFGVKI
ncbi:MAG: tRNA (N(6)-L-threonylcarbamoyladenosine(37)-C(2))-methylthiotransferase MtaB [Bacteroidetes bacterium]|nr:tRNA (N(6)-L-threonylcarbamoyladenosine(37)-C(2))-methylthiotransferase MtaB [Bacteroidota bacterium]